MLEELTSSANFSIVIIVAAGFCAAKLVEKFALSYVSEFAKGLFHRERGVFCEVEGGGGISPRYGQRSLRSRHIKWFWTQLSYHVTERRRSPRQWVQFLFNKCGFRYRLSMVVKDFRERCRCPVPYVSFPQWVSINSDYWIRDDIVLARYSDHCKTCEGKVFFSRFDLMSQAMIVIAGG